MKAPHQRVMVVLGGNAFVASGEALTMAGQFQFAESVLTRLLPVLAGDVQTLVTHGNGPQVGHMLARVEASLGRAYALPLEVCVAESEGELGYVLQQSLYNVLHQHGCVRSIAGLLTQVVVDAGDPAFRNPTKPIGPFYTREEAQRLADGGLVLRNDSGRGYRRVVPSPEPREVIEIEAIRLLLTAGVIVVAAGGGGIPVIREAGRLVGVDAVVDKDLASALLGELLEADLMLVVTGVPCAYTNFGTKRQTPIGRIDRSAARRLLDDGHFAPGSMGPKIEGCIRFTRRPGTKAVVCDPESIDAALQGLAGTIIQAPD